MNASPLQFEDGAATDASFCQIRMIMVIQFRVIQKWVIQQCVTLSLIEMNGNLKEFGIYKNLTFSKSKCSNVEMPSFIMEWSIA